MVPTDTVVGTSAFRAIERTRPELLGVTTGAEEQESVMVSGAPRLTPAAAVQSAALFSASWQATFLAWTQEPVLSCRSKVRLLIEISLTWASPSQILATVLPLELGIGTVMVMLCDAICPQVMVVPLTQEVFGQTFRQVVCQFAELRPRFVRVVRTVEIFWERIVMASLVVRPRPVTWTFTLAISGLTLRVAVPLTSIVFQPQSTEHA